MLPLQRQMKKLGVPFWKQGPRRDILLKHGWITLRLEKAPEFCSGWGRLGEWMNEIHEVYMNSVRADAAAKACLELEEKKRALVPDQTFTC